jgi:hypothetical protein
LEKITIVNLKPIVFVALSLAVVAALWLFFKPHQQDVQPVAAGNSAATGSLPPMGSASEAPPAQARHDEIFELHIQGGRPVGGPALLQVHEGEQVTLNIKSDSADELHLHGYDLYAHITPDQTATLKFEANHTGHFGLELHKAHTELGALEVYPQ